MGTPEQTLAPAPDANAQLRAETQSELDADQAEYRRMLSIYAHASQQAETAMEKAKRLEGAIEAHQKHLARIDRIAAPVPDTPPTAETKD